MAPTRPTLLSIEATGPMRFKALGQGHQGLEWVVEPGEPLERAIAMVNQYGGPGMWRITPA
jgi:hypothetical protein